MSNDILHQVGRIVTENDTTGFFGKAFAVFCNALIAFWVWFGTVQGSFVRVFDPSTWTLQDYASFASLAAALMVLLKNGLELVYARRKAKREMEQQQ